MAAGDYKAGLAHYTVTPGAGINVEFRHGVEAKDGTVETRGDTEPFSAADVAALLTQGERDALVSIATKMLAAVKSKKPKLSNSLDL